MQTNIFQLHIDAKKLSTAKASVLDLLKDNQWHTTMEILNAGGCEGTRRLRELREDGYDIECEPIRGSNEWRYRLKPWIC